MKLKWSNGILLLACIIQFFSLAARLNWVFELFSHYALYYTVLGTLFAIIAIGQRRFKSALLWMTLVSMNAPLFTPYLTTPHPPATASDTLTILSQNFYYQSTDVDEFVARVTEENPDIVIVVEASDLWKTAKEKFRTDYPYLHLSHLTGIHGIFIASRVPGNFKEVPLGEQIGLVFTPDDLSYQVLAVHPDAPLTPSWAEDRNAQFDEIARLSKTSNIPLIVMGDFNCTPYSPYFTKLLEESGLQDARLGFGLVPTWHAHNPLFWLPIDHALITSNLSVQDFKTIPAIDSDHLGIELKVTAPSQPNLSN